MHQHPREWTKEKKGNDRRKQQTTMQKIYTKIIHLKQRTSRTTKIITAMPTLYVCVHVWHYYMYVCVLVCVYLNESVGICMCTNTCTASASGKPALVVKTLPLRVIQMYFLLCFILTFDFYIWPSFYLPHSNSNHQIKNHQLISQSAV